MTERVAAGEIIEIAPLQGGSTTIRVSAEPALKATAAVTSLFLGPIGVPAALGHLAGALDVLTKETSKSGTIANQGFQLYVAALSLAIEELLRSMNLDLL